MTATPEAVPPSPNLHAYEMIVPARSKEPEPLKVSVVSVWVNWSGPAFATGASDPASVVDVVDVVVDVVAVKVPNAVALTMVEYADAVPFSAALDRVELLPLVEGPPAQSDLATRDRGRRQGVRRCQSLCRRAASDEEEHWQCQVPQPLQTHPEPP